MDYAQEQRNPSKHMVGIAVVVLLHIALVYALLNGLATKVVEVIKKPLETQIIEEIKPPPPPPPVQLPPPPKFVAPPPPYIPPPEVQVNVPPPPPTITSTSATPQVQTPIAQQSAPPAPPAPPAAPAPANARSACPNYAKAMGDTNYPREAVKAGIDHGSALIKFTVTASGEIKDIQAVSSSGRDFARAAINVIAKEFKCIGQGQDITVTVPFDFKLD